MSLFPYQTYLWYGCVLPLIGLLFGVFCLVLVLYKILIKLKKDNKGGLTPKTNLSIIDIILSLLVGSLLCFFSLHPLSNGISLLWEKESDATLTVGTVTEINAIEHSPRYVYQDDSAVRASWVRVDSVEEPLYFMTAENIEVGACLSLKYLPQSKIVLGYGSVNDLKTLRTAVAEQDNTQNILDIIFLISFIFLFLFIKFSKKFKSSFGHKKTFQKPNDEKWTENKVCYRKNVKQREVTIGLMSILLGLILAIVFQSGAAIIFVLFGFSLAFIIANNKRPLLEYDENGVRICTSYGKFQYLSFSEISVETEGVSDAWDSNTSITVSFCTTFLKKEISDVCKLDYRYHIGIDRFLMFYHNYKEDYNK
ncbi:MAG: hypothetical protein J6B71_05675 [Clostridia bacterium]|nr:hypothetical protein [Clostridia bacterium]